MYRILLFIFFLLAAVGATYGQQENKTVKNGPTSKMVLRSNSRDQIMTISDNQHRRAVVLRNQEMIKRNQMNMMRKMRRMQQHRQMKNRMIRQHRMERQMIIRRRATGR